MKVFQIFKSLCYSDVTAICPTLEDTKTKFPPELVFVETPDYVFENWGYDDTKEGDERFIKPTPPEGGYYDDATGTFLPIDPIPEPEPEATDTEVLNTLLGVTRNE